jgi:hypothetical protein
MRSFARYSSLCVLFVASTAAAIDFPPFEQLPLRPQLPDPLTSLRGDAVDTVDKWQAHRAQELKDLFQHYMYGVFPGPPKDVTFGVDREETDYFGGKATLREATISLGVPGAPALQVLEVVPNRRKHDAPVFIGLNFGGNHTLLKDPKIRLTPHWIPERLAGPSQKASDEKRGSSEEGWSLEQTIDRGYAVVTCYAGDIRPDRKEPAVDGVQSFFATGEPGEQWGTIAAWAWGMHRLVDYVQSRKGLNHARIIAFGHSRMGKTALLAAAFDPRIALAIPHQAGCGGTAPSRGTIGESVERINTNFPHWFCDNFKRFNTDPSRLPFDQHCLVALCVPRPVLLSNAVDDSWANPDGQFEMLVGASPVYALFGQPATTPADKPAVGKLLAKRLGYFIREGKHSTTPADWQIFCDYADAQLGKPE